MTIGNGQLTIVASQDLGERGVYNSPSLVVDWRWYNHLPNLAFWALALPLLVLLKENRHRQAWAILIALAAVVLGCRLLAVLLFMPPGTAETFCTFLTTVATAWTIVWLLGPWLGAVGGGVAFLIALAAMYFVGLLSYLACYGLTCDASLPPLATCYTVGVFGLLLPMLLARRSCRGVYRRSRFMARLLFWMVLTMSGGMLLFDVVMTFITAVPGGRDAGSMFFDSLPSCVLGGAVWAIAWYVGNLPFMMVAFRSDFYRERLLRVLRLIATPDQA